jgi:hypothetical protein
MITFLFEGLQFSVNSNVQEEVSHYGQGAGAEESRLINQQLQGRDGIGEQDADAADTAIRRYTAW